MFIPLPTFFVYIPLLFVAFVLSIVAMVQGKLWNGLGILFATLIGAPIALLAAWVLGIAALVNLGQMGKSSNAANETNAPVQSSTPPESDTNAPLVKPEITQAAYNAPATDPQKEVIKQATITKQETETRTLKWHQELAAQGDAYGEYRMGMRYLTGDGVDKDQQKALELLSKSASRGNKDAAAMLTKLPSQ
jgi:TPR repeat protein